MILEITSAVFLTVTAVKCYADSKFSARLKVIESKLAAKAETETIEFETAMADWRKEFETAAEQDLVAVKSDATADLSKVYAAVKKTL